LRIASSRARRRPVDASKIAGLAQADWPTTL
jgi:hypothetical protein